MDGPQNQQTQCVRDPATMPEIPTPTHGQTTATNAMGGLQNQQTECVRSPEATPRPEIPAP